MKRVMRMSRTEWLKWTLQWGRPKTRSHQIRLFLTFELYGLWCRLHGYRITHFLEEKSKPAGKCLRVTRPAPLTVRMIDKIFPAGEEAHTEYLPYTAEAEEELRRAGNRVQVVNISYT